MKRLLLLCMLLLAVPAAFAQSHANVLLTDDGIVYSAVAEWSHEHPEMLASSSSYIVLTVRQPDASPRRVVVPPTIAEGANSEPALAFDNFSGTLFVFWQYSVNAMSSELRFISLDRNGNWSATRTFETAAYHLRRNLRIALTHFAEETDDNGATKKVPEINVHATWWESSASAQVARYAMLTLRGGEIAIEVRNLSDFVTTYGIKVDLPADFNRELFRHPAIFESSNGDSVDVVFGDVEMNTMHRITVKPIGNARVHIPVGVRDKGFGPPSSFVANVTGRIEVISPHPDRLLFYFEEQGTMRFIVRRYDSWSPMRTIGLDSDMTREMAVSAMRGLVAGH